jgi:diadenosine tetraphosphatase ApaH/serine/threonine PP2A family protein phosphatase
MKYGILGDIHANLSALEAVLAEMDAEGVERILSVGDVVGYGAAPRECIEILREREIGTVLGNHDAACVDIIDVHQFNPYARAAVAWTRGQLSQDDNRWLAELPYRADFGDVHVSHGTYARAELFDYILSTTDADASLDAMELPVCFVGHSHVPITLMRTDGIYGPTSYSVDSEVDLSDVPRAVVNVGSVGQPRDENPLAAYCIYNSDLQRVWIRRCAYDIEREGARIRAAGLPEVLAARLSLGV